MAEHEDELGIAMVPFQEVVYAQNAKRTLPAHRVADADRALSLSGAELRRRLALGLEIPDWFTFPEVAQELRRAFPPRHRQGFAVLFTGLSGAGKSTLANGLAAMLRERGARRVTLLDGDVVRRRLSSELGFSRAHREVHLRRIGFVAAEIVRHGGIAICAPIAPYAGARRELRESVEAAGGFVEVYVSTPARDLRGPRPQGPLREGPGGSHRGLHRHRRPLRGAGERPTSRSTPPGSARSLPPSASSRGSNASATYDEARARDGLGHRAREGIDDRLDADAPGVEQPGRDEVW